MPLLRKERARRKIGIFKCLTASRIGVVLVVTYFSSSVWLLGVLHERPEQQQSKEIKAKYHELQRKIAKAENTKQSASTQQKELQREIAQSAKEEEITQKKGFISQETRPISFHFDIDNAERVLAQLGAKPFRRILTAYTESPMNDTIPNTGTRGELRIPSDDGTPPEFVVPLPLRTQTPEDLSVWKYPAVQTCHDVPGKLPVNRGLQVDESGNSIVWNLGSDPTPADFPLEEARHCPVELDPFLPWIHDVFYQDGKVHFIAHNKRRCRTGSKHTVDVNRLAPQVALMQPVSVQILNESEARQIAPTLWYPSNHSDTSPRYRLVPLEHADVNFTRFICRFHATHVDKDVPVSRFVGETLSEFPFNAEFIGYRKLYDGLLTPKGKDSAFFWATSILFACPLPTGLQSVPVLSDGTPLLYVDVIPIRTSTRYREVHLPASMIGPEPEVPVFDAAHRWGPSNVLPHVLASGRWENIPICPLREDEKIMVPPANAARNDLENPAEKQSSKQKSSKKQYFLTACLWASTEYKTRGVKQGALTDTTARLIEWIHFHLMVGFDHFYLYDNSGAHTNTTSLAFVAAMFPGKVTYIDWPHIVCNNNVPAHDSTGERSSQYAAENSCRSRYASSTEWIASFDPDEYLVPMGKYTNLKDLLHDASRGGTKILSFKSSRGYLRPDKCTSVESGLIQKENSTFLEAYNCDSAPTPKPEWANRARKQIYQADYVLYHFVHFATVTRGMLEPYEKNKSWKRKFIGEQVPVERATDEVHEAVMVHAKTTPFEMTINYVQECREKRQKPWKSCFVAHPWPRGSIPDHDDAFGMAFNCYINQRVGEYWVPKLRKRLGLQP